MFFNRSFTRFVMVSILFVLFGLSAVVAVAQEAPAELTTDVVFAPVVTVLLLLLLGAAVIILFFGTAILVMARSAVNSLPPSIAGTIITENNKNAFKSTVDAALLEITEQIPGKLDDHIANYIREKGFALVDQFYEPLDEEGDDLGGLPTMGSLTKGYTSPPAAPSQG